MNPAFYSFYIISTVALQNSSKYLSHKFLQTELVSRFKSPILKSFVIMDRAMVNKQASIWKTHLPFVKPFYAVKANNDTQLLEWLLVAFTNNIGFDCASINEIQTVRKISKSAKIVYAQPCKTLSDLSESARYGINTTVVDSPEELLKLHQGSYKGSTLIRLAVPDSNSKQPFSKKFGAPLEWVPEILELSKKYRIPVSGVSFHVGSECSNPEQFSKALQLCRMAIDLGTNYNMSMNIIDIGGGFLPSESNLHATASCINSERAKLFPDNLGPDNKELVWIAEPGRFLSAPSQTLYTPVIGKKRGMPSEPTEFRYTLHESIYGYFSNIPFDGQEPTFSLVHQVEKQPELTKDRTFSSILFGRTCDGADIINPNINLPLLNLGDWLMVPNMGSYTNVTASEFNGFPKPDMIYLS